MQLFCAAHKYSRSRSSALVACCFAVRARPRRGSVPLALPLRSGATRVTIKKNSTMRKICKSVNRKYTRARFWNCEKQIFFIVEFFFIGFGIFYLNCILLKVERRGKRRPSEHPGTSRARTPRCLVRWQYDSPRSLIASRRRRHVQAGVMLEPTVVPLVVIF
jgi:hypothetical protein